MESSSIVSFNNESTLQITPKNDDSKNINVHELALHAMRDRCLLLQRRISFLESDNMRLKLEVTKNLDCNTNIAVQDDDKYKLHQKIEELSKQKSHLMHHIFMVSCENKSLWSKLSNLKSDKVKLKEVPNHPPLLRTETYIQNNPRHVNSHQEKYAESTLEEISLQLINSFILEKSQLVEQYEQMAQLQDVDEDILNVDSIGFTYIEEPATDSLKEMHEQIELISKMKKQMLQQENDLKMVITKVETMLRDGHKCPSCLNKNDKNVSSEHKEIETSDSLANFVTPVDSTNYQESYDFNTYKELCEPQNQQQNESCIDKICPMCGQCFDKNVQFNEFQSHVESHFIGETEPDSLDNFENISTNNAI